MPARPFAACAPTRLYEPKLCPITNGHETRMTVTAKERACERYQGQRAICATCSEGNLPAELTIIDTKGENMGRSIVALKPCALCGQVKNTKSNHGKNVCCNCEPVWRMVNNKPETVLEALCTKQGEAWLSYRLPPLPEDTAVAPDPALQLADMTELAALREELGNAYDKIREMQAEPIDHASPQTIAALRQLNEQQATEINAMAVEIGAKDEMIEKLSSHITNLEESLRHHKIKQHSPPPCNLCADRDHSATANRDTAVLDIALQVIAGDITGINAATLAALR